MALTFNFIDDSQQGNWAYRMYKVTLDTSYPTGGYAIAPGKVKLGRILGINYLGAAGIAAAIATPIFDPLTFGSAGGKLMMIRGGTPTGTLSGNVVVKGGGIGEAIGINPDSVAGVLSKAAATDRTIPYATFLGGALTFTGTSGASPAQVANGTNLSAAVLYIVFIGNK